MATSYNMSPVAISPGGTAFDPIWSAVNSAFPQSGFSGNNLAANQFQQTRVSQAYQKYHPMFQQQNQMNQLAGLLGMAGGMGGGGGQAPGLGDFEAFFNRVKDPLMNSLMPGEDRARQQIKNRLLAEGGAGALSSGQGQAAMGTLEGELGAVREAALAKALQDSLGQFVNMRGQDTSLLASQNQMRYSLLNAILGPAVSSMFQPR